MANVLKGSPSATSMENDDSQARLSGDEQYASPVEHQMLDKVMGLVYQSFNNPQKLRQMEYMLHKAPNLGVAIGNIAFQLLMQIYMSAKHAGVDVPLTVFFGQGGAIYQTIDRLLMIAEHAGVPDANPDDVREIACGVVMDQVKKNEGLLKQPPGQPQQQQGQGQPQGQPGQIPGPQMAAANPLSHAVGQGLQQQGLLSGG